MSQEDFFAKQEKAINSMISLMSNLQKLSSLHIDINQQAVSKWQEDNITPLKQDKLKIPTAEDWQAYLTDLPQRCILYWDTLRQRGDNTLTYQAENRPLLLKFDYDVLMDGNDLADPCNYSLLRITPKTGQIIDDTLQPIVIVDPRGGHGAGIGGFKEDSEIGESLRAGHPTYFISFSYSPVPGQTIETVARAQAKFIEEVTKRHPASGKPVIVGNCQAGWAIMLLAAEYPHLPGAIIINGAPLAYWAGETGHNPMRYAGGLIGGAWGTRLASDLGNGRFDGTWLVSNFENLNPANTFWTKYYNLFSKIDSEAPRFLDFERWWGNPVLYNSEEIEAIVDDLFIGNRLTSTVGMVKQNRMFRRIESPIVVFCSSGDNITPPQQALNWIADVYPTDIDLKAAGRTIIYLQHKSVGHLGIFVSGSVARREHRQLIASLDAIKALPPGLFELVIKDIKDKKGNVIDHEVLFEPRSIKDILGNDRDGRRDEQVFSLVSRVSETNSNLYDWLIRPTMRMMISEPTAQWLRDVTPFHLNQVEWSSLNPLTWWLPGAADTIKQNRQAVNPDNPLLTYQNILSSNIINAFDLYRDSRDSFQEMLFYSIYGTLYSLTSNNTQHIGNIDEQHELIERLEALLPQGTTHDAALRILLILAHEAKTLDRDFLDHFVQHYYKMKHHTNIPEFKILKESAALQNLLVYAHPKEALTTLPNLLPQLETRKKLLEFVAKTEPALIQTNAKTKALWNKINTVLLGANKALPVAKKTKVTKKPATKVITKLVASSAKVTSSKVTAPTQPVKKPQSTHTKQEATQQTQIPLSPTPPSTATKKK